MTVEKFFEKLDALRYDTSVDEKNPELRPKLLLWYPRLRTLYKMIKELEVE